MILFKFNLIEKCSDLNNTNYTEFYNVSDSEETARLQKAIPELSFHVYLLSIWVFTIFCEELRQVIPSFF